MTNSLRRATDAFEAQLYRQGLQHASQAGGLQMERDG